MSTKTKSTKINLEQISHQVGLVLMTAAATLGMLELPDHPNAKVVAPIQPAFALAGEMNAEANNPLRREKEESGENHYISYSVAQRTPGRTGKQ